MKLFAKYGIAPCLVLACLLAVFALGGCGSDVSGSAKGQSAGQGIDTSKFLVAVEDEPDTVDFQRTTIHYTIATNVFDRLVEMESDSEGHASIVPSLAESWEVSEDGKTYSFHLRDDVSFSNGSKFTASDVQYTFNRLLAHPESCNRDILEMVVGAKRLENGETDTLEGFKVTGDYDFTITLEQPFEAFLACLSTPGASIMDEESAKEAGDRFGMEPDCTIGTGPFILREWDSGKGLILTANKNCWSGAPNCEGLDLRFVSDAAEVRSMFDKGEIDVLDLDEVGSAAEYYIHGDIYQDRLVTVPRVCIVYVALNESIAPLEDARVRKALQLSLDRQMLLDAVYDGLGSVENGIYPHGLHGFNPDLPSISFDPEEARALLSEAGYPDGFDLAITVKSSSTQWEMTLTQMIVSMWQDVGVRASVVVVDEDEFMRLRKSGQLACYSAMWTADYDDPDNFIYTFFGSGESATFRSLCYQREDIMQRVRDARAITDADKRLQEYRDLERIIVQEDAAWIPLFSRQRTYVLSERVSGVRALWNGSVKSLYRYVSINDAP